MLAEISCFPLAGGSHVPSHARAVSEPGVPCQAANGSKRKGAGIGSTMALASPRPADCSKCRSAARSCHSIEYCHVPWQHSRAAASRWRCAPAFYGTPALGRMPLHALAQVFRKCRPRLLEASLSSRRYSVGDLSSPAAVSPRWVPIAIERGSARRSCCGKVLRAVALAAPMGIEGQTTNGRKVMHAAE